MNIFALRIARPGGIEDLREFKRERFSFLKIPQVPSSASFLEVRESARSDEGRTQIDKILNFQPFVPASASATSEVAREEHSRATGVDKHWSCVTFSASSCTSVPFSVGVIVLTLIKFEVWNAKPEDAAKLRELRLIADVFPRGK